MPLMLQSLQHQLQRLKSYMRFRLVPKSFTLDDLEWPWTAKTYSVAEKMRHLEQRARIWMKIDPYYQRQISRPVILASGNIKFMGDIHGDSSWRGRQMRVGLTTTAIFGNLSGYFFGIFRAKASIIIWWNATPCQPVTDCKMNDLERLFDVKIRFRPTLCCSIDASFGAHCTNLNEDRPILSATEM